jgi:hypothetical protein
MLQGGTFMGGVTNALPESFGGGQNIVGGGGTQRDFLDYMKGGAEPAVTPPSAIGTTTGASTDVATAVGATPEAGAGRSFLSSPYASTLPQGAPQAPTSSGGALSGLGGLVDKTGNWIKANPLTSVGIAGVGGALLASSMGSKGSPAPLAKGPSGQELLASNPNRYAFNVSNFVPAQRAPYSTVVPYQPGGLGAMRMATGGIAARGGKIDGPGTGTSDSIPARLSDGEFVMTAKAVRGAGGGDRMKGARKMYEIMHKYERMA